MQISSHYLTRVASLFLNADTSMRDLWDIVYVTSFKALLEYIHSITVKEVIKQNVRHIKY